MRNSLWFELLRIPASTVLGFLRINAGMKTMPPWHFLVLGIPFFCVYAVTKIDGFLWCGALIVGGLFVHCGGWVIQYFKDGPIDPDDEGKGPDDETGPNWRKFGEPGVAVFGGLFAFYYHQWILGSWIIFAGVCLAIVANPDVADAATDFSESSWLSGYRPEFTKPRIIAAFAIAIIADLIQIPITMIETTGLMLVPGEIADCVLDFLTMGATTFLLGFHWVLLPSIFVEMVPELDLLPTWTGCVAFVIWQRKKKDSPNAGVEIDDDDDDEVISPAPSVRALSPAQPLSPIESAVESRLKRLIDLRDKNLISQAEYDAKRQRVLDEL